MSLHLAVIAQIQLGLTGGIPLTHFVLNTAAGSRVGFARVACAPRRYTVGPYAEFPLPGPLALHAGALYKRLAAWPWRRRFA